MKTALEELIKNISNRIEAGEELGYKPHDKSMAQLLSLRNLATELLSKEKQDSVDFAEWCLKEGNYVIYQNSCSIHSPSYKKITSEQLYDLFKNKTKN